MRHRLTFLLLCLGSVAFGQERVLFIGNSLTYFNDLPALVKKIGAQEGHKLSVISIAKPDYGLEDHCKEGEAEDQIRKKKFDFVVMQQGPSALNSSRINLIEYAFAFAEVCKTSGSQSALYMVWPSEARSFDFKGVVNSYTQAADSTQSILCPAGKAWLRAWEIDKTLQLYAADDFHPSQQGSLLAALVIYGSLFKKTDFSFLKLNKLSLPEIKDQEFEVLKKAAGETLLSR